MPNLQNRPHFLSQLKWVQGVLCYNQNWWKLKYLSGISTDLHETFRTGLICLFFQAGRNESKECYALIKTDKNLNISAESKLICTKPSEQGSFFWAGQNKSKKCYATIEIYENINILVEYQWFCTKPSEQGSFFWAGWNESKECYATIKTDKNLNISVESQPICTKPSEQGSFAHFSKLVKMRPRSAMIKTDKNIKL